MGASGTPTLGVRVALFILYIYNIMDFSEITR